ncbi:Gfo/Idh/MocA family oxidoreductase [Bacillus solitudinis]|uniref:Gfo/Idh/MocA family oxidoreductase n=1 Tax=Bacillus solitudinis TaxID=2014074 RepID=UPI000C2433E3|nr:Gfo/Idh/MocA family oxidoreductase [Bacillus solitudinis]
MKEIINVGLIGYGFSGRTFHAPIITSVPNMNLMTVVERNKKDSKTDYPRVTVVQDVEQLYKDERIDVLVVTTPTTNHVEFVRDALLAGKHVVVEKPFTTTVEEANELIELARQSNKMLTVYHNRRWDGDFMTVAKVLENGWIGQIKECEFRWEGFDPIPTNENWREKPGQGTGVFYDLGVHLIDQASYLFGDPETIYADIGTQREGGSADDYFHVTLGYENHLKVHLKSSKVVREAGPRYSLHGKHGSFVKFGTDPQEVDLITGKRTILDSMWGRESKQSWGKLTTSINGISFEGLVETIPGSYHSFYQNVYEHLTEKVPLAVRPEEARRSINIIELALQSSKEGRRINYLEKW